MQISKTECCGRGVCANVSTTHCVSTRGDTDTLTMEQLRKKYVRVSLYRRLRSALGKIWNKIPTGGGMKQAFRYGLLMEFSSK